MDYILAALGCVEIFFKLRGVVGDFFQNQARGSFVWKVPD